MEDSVQRYEKVPFAHLGFFTNPILIDGVVIKRYNLALNKNEAEELLNSHDSFVESLRGIGIRMPRTTGRITSAGKGAFGFEVIQDRFDESELAGEIIKESSSPDIAYGVVEGILSDTIAFLNSDLTGKMGFHPTVRNYAVKEGDCYCFDTFPPITTEKETRKLIVKSAPDSLSKVLMIAAYPFLGAYTKEYYDGFLMLSGVVKTASRLRPDISDELIARSSDFVRRGMPSVSGEFDSRFSKGCDQSFIWRVAHKLYKN